jgi:hypothetical protein
MQHTLCSLLADVHLAGSGIYFVSWRAVDVPVYGTPRET